MVSPTLVSITLMLTSAPIFAKPIPPNDKDLNDGIFNGDPEFRRGHKKPRPCRFGKLGRDEGQGKTFFDWQYQYLSVNHNTNYNINCGGGVGQKPGLGGGGGLLGGNKPGGSGGGLLGSFQGGLLSNHFASHFQDGGNGGGAPNRPILSGLLGNPPLGGLFGPSQSQSQSQTGLLTDIGQGLLSLLPSFPEGGLFNGQGISSLFTPENGGIFSNVFNRPSPAPVSNTPVVTTTLPTSTTIDPDDIIYNDEKPVHEDHDPVPDVYSNLKPGTYYYNKEQNQIIYKTKYELQQQNSRNRYQPHQFSYRDNNRLNRRLEYERPEPRNFRFPS